MCELLITMIVTSVGTGMSNDPSCLYAEMTADQLKQAIARCPVAYLPTGIPEWHGEQNACGLDALKAETLAQMSASMLGGVCFPTLWTGPGGSTPFDPRVYPRGTVTIDSEKYMAAMEELLSQTEAMGFKVAVHLSGHYPGVIPKLAEKFNQRGRMKVISVSENLVVQGMPAGDHAAAWETSLLMVLRPGLVDLSRLPPLPEGVKTAGERIVDPYEFRQRCEYYGVYGADPRVWANKTYGRCGSEAVIDGLAREVGKALDDASYGRNRGSINWPTAAPGDLEVRYDHQLPYQWLKRFEQTPVVYLPITTAATPRGDQVRLATIYARHSGGMVFPAFPYGPADKREHLGVSPEVFRRIISQVVDVLAGMNFRVIALVPSGTLDRSCLSFLTQLKREDGQTRVVVVDPFKTVAVPDVVAKAIKEMIPHDQTTLKIDGRWMINEKAQIQALSEQVFTPPGEACVYQHAFDLSDEQAKMSALLDLGTVENQCEMTLNDSPALSDHWPPCRFIVTGRLKPGPNKLKIIVRHSPQPTLDKFYYQVAPPRLAGPVTLQLWRP